VSDFDKDKVPGFKLILHHFKVLHDGWEMDNDAWVVERQDGSRAIVTTNHGGTYVAEPKEFEDKAAEYRSVLDGTLAALALVAAEAIERGDHAGEG